MTSKRSGVVICWCFYIRKSLRIAGKRRERGKDSFNMFAEPRRRLGGGVFGILVGFFLVEVDLVCCP